MIGKIIKYERKKLKLTQHQLAAKLGIPRSDISNWESSFSQVNIKNLILLADFFDCSTDYLLGRTKVRKQIV